MISRQLDTFHEDIQRQQKNLVTMIHKRLKLYDSIGTKMNRIFSYYLYVEKWKELTPDDIISYKREVDEVMYTYQPIFTSGFFKKFIDLEKELFKVGNGWGKDAKLRTRSDGRSGVAKHWGPSWTDRFTEESNDAQISTLYGDFVNTLATELSLPDLSASGKLSPSNPPSKPPSIPQ
jgi:hypothetical protein